MCQFIQEMLVYSWDVKAKTKLVKAGSLLSMVPRHPVAMWYGKVSKSYHQGQVLCVHFLMVCSW